MSYRAPAAVATQARSSLKEPPHELEGSKSKTAPADPQKDAGGGGKTKVEQGGESAPRLPHEHDQSSDSQQAPDGRPTEVGRQAQAEALSAVWSMTDRGLEANRVYKSGKIKR